MNIYIVIYELLFLGYSVYTCVYTDWPNNDRAIIIGSLLTKVYYMSRIDYY